MQGILGMDKGASDVLKLCIYSILNGFYNNSKLKNVEQLYTSNRVLAGSKTSLLAIVEPCVQAGFFFQLQRYYGESMPFGSAAFKHDKIGYLSVEQALADYAVLITYLKIQFQALESKVIAFGGRWAINFVLLFVRYNLG